MHRAVCWCQPDRESTGRGRWVRGGDGPRGPHRRPLLQTLPQGQLCVPRRGTAAEPCHGEAASASPAGHDQPAGVREPGASLPRLPFHLQPCVLLAGPRERPAGQNEVTESADPTGSGEQRTRGQDGLRQRERSRPSAGAGRRLRSFRPACSAASELGLVLLPPSRRGR